MIFFKKILIIIIGLALASSFVSKAKTLESNLKDTIFYATASDPLTLDPALGDDFDSGNILVNMYEGLVAFDDKSTNIVPCLAKSWTISKDGLTYTFKLRQGVKFHDGTPFNAEAVKFNYDRQMKEVTTPQMSYASLVLKNVIETRVIDTYTVQIILNKRSTPFLRNLAMSFSAPIASPSALAKYNNNLNEHPIGTGPFKFVSYKKDHEVILTRFDEYWGKKAKTKNLVIKTIVKAQDRINALKQGKVDIITNIDINLIKNLKKANLKIINNEGLNTNFIIFNCNKNSKSKTLDQDVRYAISMAINVPHMVQSLYKGYASYANSILPNLIAPKNTTSIKYPKYNPKVARAIFKKKKIDTLKIITYKNARIYNTLGGEVLAYKVQKYLKDVGVKTTVDVYDWETYRSKMVSDNFDIAFIGWISDNGDPDNFLNLFATDDPITNNPYWINDKYKSYIEKARATKEGKERNFLYLKAEKIMAHENPILPIAHERQLVATSHKIKDMIIHPIGIYRFKNVIKN